ncbi:MAG: hypothetical protein ACU0GG_09350 [Paracoccaceae bacterium]
MSKLIEDVIETLQHLDAIESKAYGLPLGKRTHQLSAFVERWIKTKNPDEIDQALSEAVQQGAIHLDRENSSIGLV